MTSIFTRKSAFLLCSCICLLMISLQSCKEDDPELQSLKLEINAIPNIPAEGAEKSFYIECSTQWTVESNRSWCIIHPSTGTGNASVTVTIDPTDEPTTRTAFVTVKAANLTGEITVTQVGTELGVSVSAINDVPVAGTHTSFDITTTVAWTIHSSATWCSVLPASGTGNRTVDLTVEPNNALERSATLTILAGAHTDYITITQNGISVELSKNIVDAPAAGTVTNVSVTTDVAWTAVSNQPVWCHVLPASGSGNGVLTITVDPTTLLTSRTALITVTAGVLSGTITVNQERAYTRLSDSLALVDFYNAVGMANFAAAAKWNLTAPLPAAGTSTAWPGVRINAQGRVDSLYFATGVIPAAVINAYIPESIGELKELRGFAMGGNAANGKLTGPIPESFWTLTKLNRITLSTNNLSGTISGIGNLTELTNITLLGNTLITGALPPGIGNLTKLTDLNLSNTGLTSFPIELRNCVKMANFMCYGTQISSIPEIFGNWPDVGIIQLHDSPNLTGPLPATIGSITTTTKTSVSIWLYGCKFTGPIPASWVNITTKCGQFRIQNNQLSGEIPAGVKAHANWATWYNAGPSGQTNIGAYICPQQAGYSFTNCSL